MSLYIYGHLQWRPLRCMHESSVFKFTPSPSSTHSLDTILQTICISWCAAGAADFSNANTGLIHFTTYLIAFFTIFFLFFCRGGSLCAKTKTVPAVSFKCWTGPRHSFIFSLLNENRHMQPMITRQTASGNNDGVGKIRVMNAIKMKIIVYNSVLR